MTSIGRDSLRVCVDLLGQRERFLECCGVVAALVSLFGNETESPALPGPPGRPAAGRYPRHLAGGDAGLTLERALLLRNSPRSVLAEIAERRMRLDQQLPHLSDLRRFHFLFRYARQPVRDLRGDP